MKKMNLALAFLAVLALAFPTLSLAGPCTGDCTMTIGGTACGADGVCSSLSGAGVTVVNFNTGLPGMPLYTLSGNAGLHTGSNLPFWRAPAGDTTQYLVTGTGAGVTITNLPAGDTYYGLYIGSLDSFNSIVLTDKNGTQFTITGTQIATLAHVNANGMSSLYVNFTFSGGDTLSKILLESTNFNFENDNNTFFAPQMAMPEPATLSVLGVGLFAFGAGLRRKMAGKAVA